MQRAEGLAAELIREHPSYPEGSQIQREIAQQRARIGQRSRLVALVNAEQWQTAVEEIERLGLRSDPDSSVVGLVRQADAGLAAERHRVEVLRRAEQERQELARVLSRSVSAASSSPARPRGGIRKRARQHGESRKPEKQAGARPKPEKQPDVTLKPGKPHAATTKHVRTLVAKPRPVRLLGRTRKPARPPSAKPRLGRPRRREFEARELARRQQEAREAEERRQQQERIERDRRQLQERTERESREAREREVARLAHLEQLERQVDEEAGLPQEEVEARATDRARRRELAQVGAGAATVDGQAAWHGDRPLAGADRGAWAGGGGCTDRGRHPVRAGPVAGDIRQSHHADAAGSADCHQPGCCKADHRADCWSDNGAHDRAGRQADHAADLWPGAKPTAVPAIKPEQQPTSARPSPKQSLSRRLPSLRRPFRPRSRHDSRGGTAARWRWCRPVSS